MYNLFQPFYINNTYSTFPTYHISPPPLLILHAHSSHTYSSSLSCLLPTHYYIYLLAMLHACHALALSPSSNLDHRTTGPLSILSTCLPIPIPKCANAGKKVEMWQGDFFECSRSVGTSPWYNLLHDCQIPIQCAIQFDIYWPVSPL